ncbi:MAG: hypothetical protein GTO30_03380 [Acidobacteria bacterium]|nr:hypothetical protein [Acidobacteriota bacterium]NIQ84442.1 hypothetical protein [Acidobacteriota bacterium]
MTHRRAGVLLLVACVAMGTDVEAQEAPMDKSLRDQINATTKALVEMDDRTASLSTALRDLLNMRAHVTFMERGESARARERELFETADDIFRHMSIAWRTAASRRGDEGALSFNDAIAELDDEHVMIPANGAHPLSPATLCYHVRGDEFVGYSDEWEPVPMSLGVVACRWFVVGPDHPFFAPITWTHDTTPENTDDAS